MRWLELYLFILFIKLAQPLIDNNNNSGPNFLPKEIDIESIEITATTTSYYGLIQLDLDRNNNDYKDINDDGEFEKKIKPIYKTPSRSILNSIFDFVEYLLKPTGPTDNTIELLTPKYDEFTQNDTSISWIYKENVCISKTIYQINNKNLIKKVINNEYSYTRSCRNRINSHYCSSNIKTGLKLFRIQSTTLCCPNYILNLTLNKCINTTRSKDIFELFLNNLKAINETIKREIIENDFNLNSTEFIEYQNEFNDFYNIFASDITKEKYTVYLWDSEKFDLYIKAVFNHKRQHHLTLNERFNKIIKTLKNHFVLYHYPVETIVSSDSTMVLNTLAGNRIRLSAVSTEIVIQF
jgi:hypothetical protein